VTVVKGKALARGTKPVEFTAVPYYAWDHRAAGEMAVWVPEDPSLSKAVPKATLANTSRASASHVNPTDTLDALSDGLTGSGPADLSVPRFTWWDRRGTREWVQYDFASTKKVSSVRLNWFDDTSVGGGCARPQSWQVLYRDGENWKPVTVRGAAAADAVSFEPVETSALRVQVELQPEKSGGVLEWQVAE
jgi:hypothetical protein